MSIHFISGKPGGGKSLYGLMKLVEQLVTTKRHIFTNLPVNLELLQCYFDSVLKNHIHILSRVTILDEEEVPEFYLHRTKGKVSTKKGREKDESELPAYDSIDDEGVCYILDEIHIFFNSRAWKKTGAGALFYLSQHRKLSDIVYCITQSINNVDKQFRSVAQDFTYCINERVQKFGKFRKGNGFKWYAYNSPATGGSDCAFDQGSYPLDLDLAGCYNTAGGVGVNPKGAADKGAKVKGFPLWVIWLTIPTGLLLIWFFINVALPAAFGGVTPVDVPSLQGTESATEPTKSKPAVALAETSGRSVTVSGFMQHGAQVRVMLSDGSVYAQDDEALESVSFRGVVIRGRVIPWGTAGAPRGLEEGG